MSTRTDAELLDALRNGDRRAGAELFARYRNTSRDLARHFGARGDTPDVVQDVWAQLLRSPPQLRGEDLSAYLTVSIRNRVLLQRRRSAKYGTLSSRHMPADHGTSPTQRVAHEQRLGRVWAAIEAGEFSEDELRLLELRNTVSSAEAGRELGVPASTYRGQARRALRKLAELVGLDPQQ